MKPPIEFHTVAHQLHVLNNGTREQIIEWLRWNDPNGCYSDEDSRSEGHDVLTLERARAIMKEQIERA